MLKKVVDEKYQGIVSVEYIDMDDEKLNVFEQVAEQIDDPEVPLPIVTVCDKIISKGNVSFDTIFSEINKNIAG